MTKNQKMITGAIVLLAIILIIVSVSRNKAPRAEAPIVAATSTQNITGGISLVLPETGDQEIMLSSGEGTYDVAPTATVKGKVFIGDKSIEQGAETISVIYQDPGLDSTYAWLVLFDKGGTELEQKSVFFLGENVVVTSLESAPLASGYKVLVSYDTLNSVEGVTNTDEVQTTKHNLSVNVNNGTFDPLSVILGN